MGWIIVILVLCGIGGLGALLFGPLAVIAALLGAGLLNLPMIIGGTIIGSIQAAFLPSAITVSEKRERIGKATLFGGIIIHFLLYFIPFAYWGIEMAVGDGTQPGLPIGDKIFWFLLFCFLGLLAGGIVGALFEGMGYQILDSIADGLGEFFVPEKSPKTE